MTQLMDAQNWFYWREVLDLDTVEGVVVDNTEYFLDGRVPQPYAVPEQLQFAELDTYNISQGGNQYEGILLRELVEKLGGTITWNNKTQSATPIAVSRPYSLPTLLPLCATAVPMIRGLATAHPVPSYKTTDSTSSMKLHCSVRWMSVYAPRGYAKVKSGNLIKAIPITFGLSLHNTKKRPCCHMGVFLIFS